MNTQQKELYQNIQKFSLDDADAVLSFTQRLAKDNGWTIEYTQRVINEYKKFAFLAVIAGHPVSPSSQVDQAWQARRRASRCERGGRNAMRRSF